jgi:exosortase A-associated hydrolase 2
VSPSPFYLEAPDGNRFCLFHPAAGGTVRGAILYLHPFAEEMNKSRRMAALQSQALARAGHAVLQIDLMGCGDSSGDFGDAHWGAWIADAVTGAAELRRRCSGPVWYWGLRTGALLAADAAARDDEAAGLLLWSPVESGSRYLTHLLRMKRAGSLSTGEAPPRVDALRKALDDGQPVEIGGYRVSPDMARDLETIELAELARHIRPMPVRWIETGAGREPGAGAGAPPGLDSLRAHTDDLRFRRVDGPAFWQTAEIETVPALVEATLEEIGHRA